MSAYIKLYVCLVMADGQSGTGRARGRARGRPRVPSPVVAGPSRVPGVTSFSEEPSVPIGRALARTKFSDTGNVVEQIDYMGIVFFEN